jgi:hypothetical protein
MQINNTLLNSLTDWSGNTDADNTAGDNFMQTLSAALTPDNAKDPGEQAAQLISKLSGGADDSAAGLSSSDAMFAALTQNMMQTMLQDALTPPQTAAQAEAATTAGAFSDGRTPGFGDVLDMVNPLQHIPVVSQYYRDWTGDDMGYISQVAGGALWGGSLGVAASFVNLGLTSVMGQSPTQYIQQFFAGDDATAAGSASNTLAGNNSNSSRKAVSNTVSNTVITSPANNNGNNSANYNRPVTANSTTARGPISS